MMSSFVDDVSVDDDVDDVSIGCSSWNGSEHSER